MSQTTPENATSIAPTVGRTVLYFDPPATGDETPLPAVVCRVGFPTDIGGKACAPTVNVMVHDDAIGSSYAVHGVALYDAGAGPKGVRRCEWMPA